MPTKIPRSSISVMGPEERLFYKNLRSAQVHFIPNSKPEIRYIDVIRKDCYCLTTLVCYYLGKGRYNTRAAVLAADVMGMSMYLSSLLIGAADYKRGSYTHKRIRKNLLRIRQEAGRAARTQVQKD